MKERMNINKAAPGIYKAMAASDDLVESFALNPVLKEFIRIRVSQINGCGYCINTHTKDALKLGETTQRIFLSVHGGKRLSLQMKNRLF